MWTSLEQLVQLIGRRRVVELFDEDGDGRLEGADATRVDETIAGVNDEVTSILFRKGFGAPALNALSEDASLRRYATRMLAQAAGYMRLEFHDASGRGPYYQIGEDARSALVKMSLGELRSKTEDTGAGENPIVGGDVDAGTPAFIIARDPRYPGSSGPGGF